MTYLYQNITIFISQIKISEIHCLIYFEESKKKYVYLWTILIAFSNPPLSAQQESKWGSQESVISDKCVYSEPDGIVPSRAGVRVYVIPGSLDSWSRQSFIPPFSLAVHHQDSKCLSPVITWRSLEMLQE